ncbi:MAG: DUF362 domain-containing protein [Planctomycetes bacterium]|nr:DUF362 domain-containing protein [Planctomycetota bacterium]
MTSGRDHQADKSIVAVTRAKSYQSNVIEEAVLRQFELLGGIDSFVSRGDRVLIKPNFIAPRAASDAAQTDPAVVLAIAKLLKEAGAKPFVADSPAWKNTAACVKILGLEGPLKKLGVPVRNMDKPRRFRIAGANIGISSVALEADKIINVPKLKAHQQLGATFAVKNMFGCVCGKEKAFRHFSHGRSHDRFTEMLIGIYKLLGPAVSIIDGVIAMEGMGPLSGEPKEVGFLIGSRDPIACELVCCKIVDFDPGDLPIIQTAGRMDFGCSGHENVEVVGDNYMEYRCRDFKPAIQSPLYFTFPRICKSIVKQLILMIRGKS